MDTIACDFKASENLIDLFVPHEYAIKFLHMSIKAKGRAQRVKRSPELCSLICLEEFLV